MPEEPRSAAEAFDALRAEVAVLRRTVEGLSGALAEHRPADYSLDLGRIRKELSAAGDLLTAIEAHPALRLTPQQFDRGIASVGEGIWKGRVWAS